MIIRPPKQFLIRSPPSNSILLTGKDVGCVFLYSKPPLIVTPEENKRIKHTKYGDFLEEKFDAFARIMTIEIKPFVYISPSMFGFWKRKTVICA